MHLGDRRTRHNPWLFAPTSNGLRSGARPRPTDHEDRTPQGSGLFGAQRLRPGRHAERWPCWPRTAALAAEVHRWLVDGVELSGQARDFLRASIRRDRRRRGRAVTILSALLVLALGL